MSVTSKFLEQQWIEARREYALVLRREGLTFREIGARFGVGKDMARILVICGRRALEQ